MKKSYFIIPLSVFFHLATINLTLYLLTPETYRHGYSILYYNIAWFIATSSINFYNTARREGFMTNFGNFVRLFVIYGFIYLASFSIWGKDLYSTYYLIGVYFLIFLALTSFRILFYGARALYRSAGKNLTKVVVIGWDKNLKKIRSVFDVPNSGFKYVGFFDNTKSKSPTYLGDISSSYTYIFENNIDEVYCTVSKLSKEELQQIMKIADNSLKKIKIIPDNKELFSRAMSIDLYGSVPVLNLRASPLDLEYAKLVKRAFDIVFSSCVLLFILSWLIPIMFVLMRFDSKGPLFFKQERHGVNLKTFWCYKFRSMTKSKESDRVMASKNDMRITRLGHILRKTSIDELPQFYNVLKGDMSVVGPRPHMVFHTQEFENTIDKYLVRHFLKPGVTGLAQIQGYRGEIVTKSDIVNRVRYDIFYMEKWSLRLDAKIIFLTLYNAVNGDEKAY